MNGTAHDLGLSRVAVVVDRWVYTDVPHAAIWQTYVKACGSRLQPALMEPTRGLEPRTFRLQVRTVSWRPAPPRQACCLRALVGAVPDHVVHRLVDLGCVASVSNP